MTSSIWSVLWQTRLSGYLRDLATQPVANLWHPLSVASHDGLRTIWGPHHWVHHLANLLLHLLAGGLLARWFTSFSLSRSLAFLLALIWVVHPLAIEPTAWISGRKEILLAVFSFLALALNQNPKHLFGVSIAVFAAFLCKPTAIVLPVLLMADSWVKSEQNVTALKSILKRQGWLLLGSLLLVLLTIHFQSLGTQNQEDARGWIQKLAQAGWALRLHFQHFVWPRGLHVGYLTPSPSSPAYALLLPLLLLLSTGLLFFQKAPAALRVGLFIALLFLLPTLGLIRAGNDLVTDRYAYVAMAGLLLALVGCIPAKKEPWVASITLLVAALLVTLSVKAANLLAQHRGHLHEDSSSRKKSFLRRSPARSSCGGKRRFPKSQKSFLAFSRAQFPAASRAQYFG